MARAPKKDPHAPEEEVVDTSRPRYRVIEKSFIEHAMHEEGAEVTYDGDVVGDNLSPLSAAAQRVVDAQKEPHPDKSDGKKPKDPRRAADAAAAGVGAEEDEELA
jgi:hypothetical protein